MLTTIVLAGALLATPQAADKWDIKAALAPKTTMKWDITTAVVQGGQEHSATWKLVLDSKDPVKDKGLAATISWNELMLDGGQGVPDQTWDVTLSPMGSIAESDASEGVEAIRTMLMPFMFVYPDKAVGVGDTWSDTIKAGTEKADTSMTCEMKAEGMEKVGDVDALKITEKISQKGDAGLNGTGTWWVGKDGKVLKFETKVTGWAVPMAGPDPMDATFTGTLSK